MKLLKQSLLFIAAVLLLNVSVARAQHPRLPADKMKLLHNEKQSDSYIPNRWNNQKVTPAYKYQINAAQKMLNSSITTTQVNINSSGQNIWNDAANEPNIAVNPLNPNQMVIGWRQFDNISNNFRQAGWAYTTNAGLTWTFPGVIEPGIFRSDPVLDFDAAGNFYYNSLTNSPDYFCKVFKSANGGTTWNTGTDAAGGDKQWMAIDRTAGVGSGNIYSTWTSAYSTCIPDFFTRSTNGAASFEPCTFVDDEPWWMQMAVGNAGELFIGGGGMSNDSLVVVKSLNAQNPGSVISWNAPVQVYLDGYLNGWISVNPSGLLGQTNIDIDRSGGPGNGNVYLLASVSRLSNSDPGDVMFSKSTNGGLTWSAPVKINDDASVNNTQWFATMSVAPNGRIDVVWLDTRIDLFGLDSSALYYSYSVNQGVTWSANEKLSPNFDPHIGYPNQDKMGDYFDMISDNGGAHLAWANTFNSEQDVYYSHIVPPVGTSTGEISFSKSVSVFPNPNNGLFFVAGNGNPEIEITNLLGEEIYSAVSVPGKAIDISSQPAGIYFLKVTGMDGETAVMKIVKE